MVNVTNISIQIYVLDLEQDFSTFELSINPYTTRLDSVVGHTHESTGINNDSELSVRCKLK